jgi:predicted restriction endonuclease
LLPYCTIFKIKVINSKYGTSWSRNELILALYLYCKVPFARTKANNPEVIRLATLLGRTPSSVARKLGNFGAFDPLLAKEGISGLTHVSRMDREIWNEFYGRWDTLVEESQRLLRTLPAEMFSLELEEMPIISRPDGPTERPATVLTRLCQSFFRKAILSSYESTCCICGIDLPPLLVASHIVPWSANTESRSDPENGLCLCALHDRAFDRGLISLKASLEIIVSSSVKSSKSKFAKYTLQNFQDKRIILPRRFHPKPEYLQWHLENRFLS